MAKYEDKFIVINRKRFDEIEDASDFGGAVVKRFLDALDMLNRFCVDNNIKNYHKYYVVNQDESYSKNVIKFILDNESSKEKVD